MNLLVTGGAGYIGCHIVKELVKQGHVVVVFDNLSKGHSAALPPGTLVVGDLADETALDLLFDEFHVDGVIHMAADSLVGESMTQPAKYFENNVGNGLKLLRAMLNHDVKKLVFSSTAAVYGEPVEVPITEDHPTAPTNVYGETKLTLERVLQRYDEAYGLKYVSLRYFNAAGADASGEVGEDHDPETHLIPIVLDAAKSGEKTVKVFGDDYPTPDGTAIRDYIHVSDLASAHILALHRLMGGETSRVYNLGSEHGYSVLDIINRAGEVTGRPIPVEMTGRRAGDPAVLVASSALIRAELGWRPHHSELETIVASAWRWHSAHPAGFEASAGGE